MVNKASRINKIVEDIKSVKIQGAENVARAGIKAYLLDPTKKTANKLLKSRPTEPLLQNFLRTLQKSKNPKTTSNKLLVKLKKDHDKIAKTGSSLIRSQMNIYTHCHSSTVMDILKYAKEKRKKKFVVYTSEVEPLLQGHLTAKELAKANIKVVLTPDLAAEAALKQCDLFFFGVDAYTKKLAINKIGTSTLCRLAKLYNIPRYVCGVSQKFTKKVKIEMRPSREVIFSRNKNLKVINPAFDKTPLSLLTGVISEFGILKPASFVKKAKLQYN